MTESASLVCRLRYEGRYEEESRCFTLDRPDLTLGRASGSDLVLNHESVSRAHARFTRGPEGWTIHDLQSKNGVRVNTYRVQQQLLRDGDRIDLGSARLHVEIGPAARRVSTADVVFAESEKPNLHTEVLEMSGLTSLMGPSTTGIRGAGRVADSALADDLSGGVSVPPAPEQSAELIGLVSEAAEALIACDSLDQTLERILSLVFNNLPVERGVICLYDEASGKSEPKVMRTLEGVPDEAIHISSNIVRHATQQKQALLVKDTLQDERFGGAQSVIMMEIHSVMCAPLYRDERVVGFIYVDRQGRSTHFDALHLQALSALAVLSAVAVEQAGLQDRLAREHALRSQLARYSSPVVVDRILDHANATTGGMVTEEGEVSVLFADLVGFTGMAENLPAHEVIGMLNRVFERLTAVVFELDGTLDKFRGDGMMAFFGAPLLFPDHAERAVEAALRMQEALHELNADSLHQRELRMRIGINSGSVVVGDIGSPQRKDYTVIGDVVNIASRLESEVARPGEIVIGRPTFEMLGPRFRCEELERVKLKGKREGVAPYRVLGR